MSLTKQIATNFRAVFFGGNWTVSCFKKHLENVTLKQATQKICDLNTILVLTYHSYYFILALIDVLEGKPLTANDKYSFTHPKLDEEQDWQNFLQQIWNDVEKAALLIEQLPDEKLFANFADEKYGNYYRNINGIIEHIHYHLGQIVLIKKMIVQKELFQNHY